jgi:hypothetical protein
MVQLPLAQPTVLAMYYHENLEPTELAACLGLPELGTACFSSMINTLRKIEQNALPR